MNFKNGYLGCMIVVLAIVFTAVGSWALSMDVEEKQSIRYDYVTELTGLFDSEQAPTYISYNPSVNQTGYYTDQSTKYFDGVDATLTSQRNQYKVNAAPIDETSPTTLDLTTLNSDAGNWMLRYWTTDNTTTDQVTGIGHLSFESLLTGLGMSTYDKISMISPAGSFTTGGFVTFVTGDMIKTSASGLYDDFILMKNPALTGTLVYNDPGVPSQFDPTYDATSISNPILAASYDSLTGYVTLYYDTAMTDQAGLFTANNIHIIWEGSESGSFTLGHEITYSGADYPDNVYMVIRDGVSIS